jgi:hypothetical protein
MLSYTLSTQKMKRGNMAVAKGHNLRLHPTASQLPQSAWLLEKPLYTLAAWRDDRVAKACELATRKDAVVGIELTFQVGNQTDWRSPPTKKDPHGKPKKAQPAKLRDFSHAVRDWLVAEFGEANVVSVVLHADESTPHIQAVVVPIKDGKLCAKHWLDGPARLSKLWSRSHAAVSKVVECSYTPGSMTGGKPHDPGKAAGAAPVPGLIDQLTGHTKLTRENKELRARLGDVEQLNFSATKQVVALTERAEAAEAKAIEAERERDRLRARAKEVYDLEYSLRPIKRDLELLQAAAPDLNVSSMVKVLAADKVARDALKAERDAETARQYAERMEKAYGPNWRARFEPAPPKPRRKRDHGRDEDYTLG